ncbi:hypothetical protein AVEN_135435-1 [Araneus ventricosus]|uniref:Uncharacterized protein n=1 Tax=Araneus ventricosus TaxID=182803 RepID=A0A4Y2BFI7_ARAVE|nr:hypothetical protein AVEN_135435-1 [Araneus ventricosus]
MKTQCIRQCFACERQQASGHIPIPLLSHILKESVILIKGAGVWSGVLLSHVMNHEVSFSKGKPSGLYYTSFLKRSMQGEEKWHQGHYLPGDDGHRSALLCPRGSFPCDTFTAAPSLIGTFIPGEAFQRLQMKTVITVAFTTFVPRCVICNRVPFRSLGISRLRISNTGTPTINLGLSEGAPDNSKMLKSSTGYDAPS